MFGDTIKTIREARKLSQSAFAKQMGVTQKAVSLWESGSVCPRVDKLPDICRTLGCRIDDLFEEMGEGREATPHAAEAGQMVPPGALAEDCGVPAGGPAATGAAEAGPNTMAAGEAAGGMPWWRPPDVDDEDMSWLTE